MEIVWNSYLVCILLVSIVECAKIFINFYIFTVDFRLSRRVYRSIIYVWSCPRFTCFSTYAKFEYPRGRVTRVQRENFRWYGIRRNHTVSGEVFATFKRVLPAVLMYRTAVRASELFFFVRTMQNLIFY